MSCVHKLKFNVNTIKETIDKDLPVIICLSGSGWSHASLCIGYEYDAWSGVTKLLLLDPSGDMPKCCCWNAFVDLFETEPRKKYKYHYVNDKGDSLIKLDDFLVITPVK